MSQYNFIDYVKVFMSSGKGGPGCVSFRREKFIPKGGPNGGNGGKGGDIILKGDKQLSTLIHLKYKKYIKAENGGPGGKASKSGTNGKDIIINVPLGTVAKDALTNEILAEIKEHNDKVILLTGGIGGLGNENFKTPYLQAPRHAQPGKPGIEASIILELKLIADIGVLGLPNAGKSTLLKAISNAKAKIADYPFTTLVPNLGIVKYKGEKSFVMADLPGIIKDAHKGKGLGSRFLKHAEHTKALLFLIDINSESILATYNLLLQELKNYDVSLLAKKRLLAISKADIEDDNLEKMLSGDIPNDVEVIFISSHNKRGLDTLKDKLWGLLTIE